tara:strand:- start:1661 stop:1909 length:249 start_codon:yes stop_codon:yes gene_type:complete
MPHSNEGEKPSIVGVGEIAEILQVPTTHVSMMIQRMTIPEADWVINSGRTKVWLKSTIMDWAKNTGKLPFDKMMEVDIRKER